jgi:hypothetical protein
LTHVLPFLSAGLRLGNDAVHGGMAAFASLIDRRRKFFSSPPDEEALSLSSPCCIARISLNRTNMQLPCDASSPGTLRQNRPETRQAR